MTHLGVFSLSPVFVWTIGDLITVVFIGVFVCCGIALKLLEWWGRRGRKP